MDAEREFFNEILLNHTKARPVVSALRKALTARTDTPTTLEQALAAYRDRHEHNPNLDAELMAFRRYLRDVLLDCTAWANTASRTAGITNYTDLVAACVQWACDEPDRHACFVSFNYDLLVDQALEDSTDFRIENRESYVSVPHASLLKPHGSAAWFTQRHGEEVQMARDLPEKERQRVALRPLLALPVVGKTELLWPTEQATRFDTALASLCGVLTVGWRAADATVRDALHPYAGKVPMQCVVGPCDDADLRLALQPERSGENQYFDVSDEGFSPYMEGEQLEWFLNYVSHCRKN